MTATVPVSAVAAAPPAAAAPVPLTRLTMVELRKLADTRAGMWLLIVIGLATVATSAILLGGAPDNEITFSGLYSFGLLPSAVLLPVLGIFSVTSEWSQRTALATFTLVPARGRVLLAKIAAGILIAIAATAATAVLAAAANALTPVGGGDGSWSLDSWLIWQSLLLQIVLVLMGIAFGALLLNTPLAIVVFFALPTVGTILGETIRALRDAAQWLDLSATSQAMSKADMTSGEWARLAASAGVWVVLLLLIGVARVLRREVS
ncbi:ABC transporter permease [Actinoplanes sp. NEAU-A12]|uniref:ABC transporter permease n=1 Tax=Actinoplanes sandaracinus TaxID=3045177 RepID=A0ABT6X0Y7_9ACTN|nr:ABC transporter permease [Actinoplanes sandaracinus]MDI6105485.1 ABC transporter permease [Actinoplanes sandaracinus]